MKNILADGRYPLSSPLHPLAHPPTTSIPYPYTYRSGLQKCSEGGGGPGRYRCPIHLPVILFSVLSIIILWLTCICFLYFKYFYDPSVNTDTAPKSTAGSAKFKNSFLLNTCTLNTFCTLLSGTNVVLYSSQPHKTVLRLYSTQYTVPVLYHIGQRT